jgi:hypothetical protein
MSNKTILKTFFEAGDRPTALQFADLIDSSLNFEDDKATDAQAEDSSINNKFITPKTARKSVEKFAPVKKVNGNSPDSIGQITIAVGDISNLQDSLDAKQPRLVSGVNGNIKTINNVSILVNPTSPTVTNIQLPSQADLDLKMNLSQVSKVGSIGFSSINTSGRDDVTGMSFSAVANKKYKVEIFGDYQSTNQAVGGSLGFALSTGGAGTIKGIVEMQTSASASEKKLINTIGDFITSSQVSSVGSANYLNAILYFECSSTCTFKLQWGVEASGTAKLNAGTVMIATQLN